MAGARDSDEEPTDDELVRRLRELDWPGPPPGLKERSLEEFERRLEQRGIGERARAAAREH